MMPMNPMSIPFCEFVQSNTLIPVSRCVSYFQSRKIGEKLTVKGQESQRKLDAGEQSEEEEVNSFQRLEQADTSLDIFLSRQFCLAVLSGSIAMTVGRLSVHLLLWSGFYDRATRLWQSKSQE